MFLKFLFIIILNNEIMKDILREKKKLRLTWDQLAQNLNITGDGLRMAFSRESVDEFYLEELRKRLGIYKESEPNDQHSAKEESVAYYDYSKKKVPYYDIDVTSHITTSFSDVKEIPSFYVDYKPFNDCTAYVNNFGDSMYPKYKNGEKLAVKQIFNLDIISWGETFLIVTNQNANDLRTIKDVHPHEDNSKIILRASNPQYKGDTIINKEDILSMFSVKGKISQNFI